MNDDGVDAAIRQVIDGDAVAALTMAALLQGDLQALGRAESLAMTSRDRQVVAIARAHLAGDSELVDALARDHLVTFPDSLIVSWIASR
jgi:hypothetical protein